MPAPGRAPFAYTLVDVFSTGPASGNPLAVVHDADELAPARMQEVARYLNLSETVFLCRPSDPGADYAVRIFALDRELPWAGHPTLGACHAWLEHNFPGARAEFVQQSPSGLTRVRREDDALSFAAPPLLRFGPLTDNELNQALLLVGSDGTGLLDAMRIDNGPGWVGLLFDRAETIRALRPQRLWPAHLHIGAIAIKSQRDCCVEARAFHTDQHRVAVEDPVTGSFAAAAARWLIGNGTLPGDYSISQGHCIGRSGRIDVATRNGEITISGWTRTIIRGHAHF